MNDEFLLIEAAAGDAQKIRVMGLAYSGGKMKIPGWKFPVVVDLSGLEIPDAVPLLTNHENRTGSRVGMVKAMVEDNSLVIEGEILSSSAVAQGIVEQAKAGADWQLSIGADVTDSELVQGQRTVNGQVQKGPFYHVKKSVLREVSVVAVGADGGTHLRLAAKFLLHGGEAMEFEKWLESYEIDATKLSAEQLSLLKAAWEKGDEPPDLTAGAAVPAPKPSSPKPAQAAAPKPEEVEDKKTVTAAPAPSAPPKPKEEPTPSTVTARGEDDARIEAQSAVKAERDRVAAIQDVCAGEFPQIEREAIRLGWTPEETSQKVLKAIREGRPQADSRLGAHHSGGGNRDLKAIEAALCLRAGISAEFLAKEYGEQVMESAWQGRDMSLQQLFVECARLEGITLPKSFGNDTIRAGFSTVSLPGILNNVANKRLLKSFQAQPVVATRLCSEGELNDFKESERYRLTDVGDLEPIAPDGELKHGGAKEDKATNQLGTFGKIFTLTRQMIYNDDLGAFLKVPEGMGARAARKIDQLFFERLMSNPGGLFSTAHRNYKEGADTALSGDSLAVAVQMFLDQVDADDQPINVSPKFLLVPTALKMTAKELLKSTLFIAVGATNKQRIPTYNALADEELEVLASPYLSNTNYAGASAKAWYLFADPNIVDTFEVGYLKGRRTPTVERGETDFDTLGIKFRVYFDLGVREQDWRGVAKHKGE